MHTLSDFIIPCLPMAITKGKEMTEDRSKWITQIIGSVIIQLVAASIIGTVIMYGGTERLTERMIHVEKELSMMRGEVTKVQIELAKYSNDKE